VGHRKSFGGLYAVQACFTFKIVLFSSYTLTLPFLQLFWNISGNCHTILLSGHSLKLSEPHNIFEIAPELVFNLR
jgi:hypothetical protein